MKVTYKYYIIAIIITNALYDGGSHNWPSEDMGVAEQSPGGQSPQEINGARGALWKQTKDANTKKGQDSRASVWLLLW